MFKKVCLTALILLTVVIIAGCASQQGVADGGDKSEQGGSAAKNEVIRLRYADYSPENTMYALMAREFAELVKERTDGRVVVENYHAGTLLGIVEMFDGVLEGVSDIGFAPFGIHPGRFGLLDIFDIPLMIPDAKVGTAVVVDLLNEFEHDFFEEIKVLASFATTPTYILTKDRVETTEDLDGVEIRVPSPPYVPMLESLGAVPVMMPMVDFPEALQMGIVQGTISMTEVLKDFMFGDTLKYVIDYPLLSTVGAVFMDRKVWDELPKDVQQVLEEVGMEINAKAGDYLDTYTEEALAWSMAEQNVEIITLSPAEKAKWDAALEPFVENRIAELEAKGLPVREAYERIYESVNK